MAENTQEISRYTFRGYVEKINDGRNEVTLLLKKGSTYRPLDTFKVDDVMGRDLTDCAFDILMTKDLSNLSSDSNLPIGLYEALCIAQEDRLNRVHWTERRFRFIKSENHSPSNPEFVLTSDKTGVLEYKVFQEKSRLAEALRKEEEAKRARIRETNYSTIERFATSYLENGLVDSTALGDLKRLGIIEPTTPKRSETYGEDTFLRYDFERDGVRHAGFFGFNDNGELIVDDRRLPEWKVLFKDKPQED